MDRKQHLEWITKATWSAGTLSLNHDTGMGKWQWRIPAPPSTLQHISSYCYCSQLCQPDVSTNAKFGFVWISATTNPIGFLSFVLHITVWGSCFSLASRRGFRRLRRRLALRRLLFTHSFTDSLTLLTHSLTLTHSPTHSLTDWLTAWLTHCGCLLPGRRSTQSLLEELRRGGRRWPAAAFCLAGAVHTLVSLATCGFIPWL